MKNIIGLVVSCLCILSCTQHEEISTQNEAQAKFVVNTLSPFSDFWDQGQAEITTYDLQQARYGEIHVGTANTIFVTEPFSKSKQVKLDNPGSNTRDNIPVMKLNFARKFYTGVYPYSTMLSVFTPQDFKKNPNSMKVVFGAQEWCGQTYSQMNLTSAGYEMEQYSYFESEGDKKVKLDKVLLEDEVWNKVRINPADLPTGKLQAIPGLTFTRLAHHPAEAIAAEATLSKNGKMNTYSLYYPAYERTLSIQFEAAFPHRIERWSEEGFSGFGAKRKKLTTTATVKSRKMMDYWNKHDLKDAPLRAELGLN